MPIFYFALSVLGALLPISQAVTFLSLHGPDWSLFVSQAAINPASRIAWLDVILSSIAFFGFLAVEGRRLEIRRLWIYVVANLTVGLSLALPLFLYRRSQVLAAQSVQSQSDLAIGGQSDAQA